MIRNIVSLDKESLVLVFRIEVNAKVLAIREKQNAMTILSVVRMFKLGIQIIIKIMVIRIEFNES